MPYLKALLHVYEGRERENETQYNACKLRRNTMIKTK